MNYYDLERLLNEIALIQAAVDRIVDKTEREDILDDTLKIEIALQSMSNLIELEKMR